jgi:acyl-CoA synthetase (AMP-forming)/AMP-acid ligase II
MKTGGYRVNPEEVEAPLRDAVAPAEITIVGLPSSYWGEIITAVVVGPTTPPGLAQAITQLTSYKRPRLLAELDEIPRNAIGKVERRKARDIILEHYILEDGPYPRLTRRSRPAK